MMHKPLQRKTEHKQSEHTQKETENLKWAAVEDEVTAVLTSEQENTNKIMKKAKSAAY